MRKTRDATERTKLTRYASKPQQPPISGSEESPTDRDSGDPFISNPNRNSRAMDGNEFDYAMRRLTLFSPATDANQEAQHAQGLSTWQNQTQGQQQQQQQVQQKASQIAREWNSRPWLHAEIGDVDLCATEICNDSGDGDPHANESAENNAFMIENVPVGISYLSLAALLDVSIDPCYLLIFVSPGFPPSRNQGPRLIGNSARNFPHSIHLLLTFYLPMASSTSHLQIAKTHAVQLQKSKDVSQDGSSSLSIHRIWVWREESSELVSESSETLMSQMMAVT